jgi:hypothetical protein
LTPCKSIPFEPLFPSKLRSPSFPRRLSFGHELGFRTFVPRWLPRMNRLQFVFILWLVWGTVSLMALVIVLFRPAVWNAWIDRENNYWVNRGRFSTSFADKIKKLEKGLFMKILLACNVALSILVICLLFRFNGHPPFRALAPPPAPVVPHQLPPPRH